MESFLVNIIPGAYTSTCNFLLLIAWKMNFYSSRQPSVFFLLRMFCNDWIPFCSRNLLDPCTEDKPKGSDLHFQPGFGKIQFLFVGQSLYLYILLFIGSTPSRSCVSATLKQYISITFNYYLRSCPFSLPQDVICLASKHRVPATFLQQGGGCLL